MSSRKLPPDEEVLRLLEQEGLSTYAIAKRYGASRQAVSYCLRRNDAESPRARAMVKLDIPWQVRAVHNMAQEIRRLRILERIRQGLPVRDRDRTEAEHWASGLRLAGRVVAYNPATGFYTVPRLPQDGNSLVRR